MLVWCEGCLVFDDLFLFKVLLLINCYFDVLLVLGDRSVVKLCIGGIYSICDICSLVDVLLKVLFVDLEYCEDGSICISSCYVQF